MKTNNIHNIALPELSKLFGTTEEDIQDHCSDILDQVDLSYRFFNVEERDRLILQVIKRIYSSSLTIAGGDRHSEWEQGWRENLDEFLASGYQLEKLIPKYFKKDVPARLNSDYIMPVAPNFVFDYTNVYRTWLFRKFLSHVPSIYEFGCGPAYHLAYLAQIYPNKKIVGLDWASPSQELIKQISEHYGWDISGRWFDFLEPDPKLHLDKDSGIFTFGALEQIGGNHGAFLEFLLKNKPAICVNVECIQEFYDDNNLISSLALQYHKKRKYLSGYLTALKKLETEDRIEIIACHYHRFGNLFDDPLSYVVWKPK
jgi:SAM-dependent methyltransferase